MKHPHYLILVAGLLLAVTPCVTAGNVYLLPGESDALTVLDPHGNISQRISTLENNPFTPEDINTPYAIYGFNIGNPNMVNTPLVLTEPNTSPNSPSYVSDVVAVFTGPRPNQYYLGYVSDGEGPNGQLTILPSALANATIIPETNQPVNVTNYLNPALQAAGWTAYFQSDVDAVPEPASLSLLGLGAAGLVGFAARRRKAVAG